MTLTTEAPRRRLRQFRRAEAPPSFQITQRDVEIVRQSPRPRFLRSPPTPVLLGGPHKKILERLKFLFPHGYLDKPPSQRDYQKLGGGNAPTVSAPANRGAGL